MNTLPVAPKIQFLGAIVEGMGVRAACRLARIAKGTGLRLIREVGAGCEAFQRQWIRDLDTTRVEADEIWAFCYSKEKNVPAGIPQDVRDRFGWGVWTWTALDSTSKLMITWRVGDRSTATGDPFIQDIADRVKGRIQLSTDGHAVYPQAVELAFAGDIDYATVVKEYASTPGNTDKPAHVRYSPGECLGVMKKRVQGDPDMKLASTSYVERSNLAVRMLNRRFTRLTNSFSRRIEYHRAALGLTFFYYNFCRKHSTLKGRTPAMAAGIATTVWSVRDMLFAADA